jgi:cathepsin B
MTKLLSILFCISLICSIPAQFGDDGGDGGWGGDGGDSYVNGDGNDDGHDNDDGNGGDSSSHNGDDHGGSNENAINFIQGLLAGVDASRLYSDLEPCLNPDEVRLDLVDQAINDIRSDTKGDVERGISTLADVADIVPDMAEACNVEDEQIYEMQEVIGNFHNPETSQFTESQSYLINGREIYYQLWKTMNSREDDDWYRVGLGVGKAMNILILGDNAHLNGDLVEFVNSFGIWEAEIPEVFEGLTLGEIKARLGVELESLDAPVDEDYPEPDEYEPDEYEPDEYEPDEYEPDEDNSTVWDPPRLLQARQSDTSFDARNQWSRCKSIGSIRNQNNCGSCWAFAAATSLSDRLCVASGGNTQVSLSTQYLISCVTSNKGCATGGMREVWDFLQSSGTVTESCWPYASSNGQSPACNSFTKCKDGKATKKYFAKSNTFVTLRSPNDIKKDLKTNGPSTSAFQAYEDFYYFKGTKPYKHILGSLQGGHAVKLIGWRNTGNTVSWIAANSWGTTWGNRGFFEILDGESQFGRRVGASLAKI